MIAIAITNELIDYASRAEPASSDRGYSYAASGLLHAALSIVNWSGIL